MWWDQHSDRWLVRFLSLFQLHDDRYVILSMSMQIATENSFTVAPERRFVRFVFGLVQIE